MREVRQTYAVPEHAHQSRLADFMAYARQHTGLPLADWAQLSHWSSERYLDFWRLLFSYFSPIHEGTPEPVCVGDAIETASFFPKVRLNYAENLLRARGDDERVVLRDLGESGPLGRRTRGTLRAEVLGLAGGLAALGINTQSRVCALARNQSSSILACLASASLGASWSSVAPDMGPDSVLSRFGPLAPELLFAHTHQELQGQSRPLSGLIRTVLEAVPSIRVLVILDDGELDFTPEVPVFRLSALTKSKPIASFARVPFNHPLFVMFSSGTTGSPKCIVHGHGGTLIEHYKELALHTDLRRDDTLCFITGAGWMMWNWVMSTLVTDADVILFDGSVSYPEPDSFLQHIAHAGVTVLGASPAYLRYLDEAQIVAIERCDLSRLRAILSTGSILFDDQFDYVERSFGKVALQSISGGTDILGCFVLGNPLLPVYRGESQSISLGLDVRARDGDENLRVGNGELVCINPYPSRPTGLFGDPDGRRFHDAYFSQHEGLWTHGDLIELTDRGTARILGRSDGVINVRGVRIGPAEIYGIVGRLPEVVEAMAVDQEAPTVPGGKKLVLLVVLRPGLVLDRSLGFRIKRELRDKAGQTHVPDVLLQVDMLPQTHNGKRSERALQDLLSGRRPRNWAALKNHGALHALLAFPELEINPELLKH